MKRSLKECWDLIEAERVKHKVEIEKYAPMESRLTFNTEPSWCKLDGRQAGYYWLSLSMWNNSYMESASFHFWEIGRRDMRDPKDFKLVYQGSAEQAHHAFGVLEKWYRRQWLRDMRTLRATL